MAEKFNVQVGAKRQVTLPARLLQLLDLVEGDQLQVHFDDDGLVTLVPMVSVPRHLVSPSLLEKMEARRGSKPSDIPLNTFLNQLRSSTDEGSGSAAASKTPQEAAKDDLPSSYGRENEVLANDTMGTSQTLSAAARIK